MVYLTPEGKNKLEEELKNLVAKRPQVSKRIEKAKEMGDLKENAEYHDAKDEQGMMESRIREIQATLAEAQVIEKKTGEVITFGSKIKVQTNEKEKSYEIVGASEANPLAGKISSESPLGKAFFGRRKGDIIEAEVPAGTIKYEIKEVE